jgi:hypothetical protein
LLFISLSVRHFVIPKSKSTAFIVPIYILFI